MPYTEWQTYSLNAMGSDYCHMVRCPRYMIQRTEHVCSSQIDYKLGRLATYGAMEDQWSVYRRSLANTVSEVGSDICAMLAP